MSGGKWSRGVRITSTPEGISWISELSSCFGFTFMVSADELRAMGKNKWQPIESGMIEWQANAGNNDPADDLANVTLTLPTPPASAYPQQHQQPRIISTSSNGAGMYASQGRAIRPFPRRNVSQSTGPQSARIMSVNMDIPYGQLPPPTTAYFTPAPQTAPPMYGEDEVPMSVQLPSATGMATPHHSMLPGSASATSPMPPQSDMNTAPFSSSIPLQSTPISQEWSQTPIAAPASQAPVSAPEMTPTEIHDQGNGTITPEAIKSSPVDEPAHEGEDGVETDEVDPKEFDDTDFTSA